MDAPASSPDPPGAPTDHRPVIIELLKIRQGEAFAVMKYYEAALTAFLLITGGLLKFALDANATPVLKRALESMGVAICLIGLVAAVAGEYDRRMIRDDIARFFLHLSLPLPPDKLDGPKTAILICSAIFMVALAGWVFLLIKA
jgi:hypothetical protein